MVWHQACPIWLMFKPDGSWRGFLRGRIKKEVHRSVLLFSEIALYQSVQLVERSDELNRRPIKSAVLFGIWVHSWIFAQDRQASYRSRPGVLSDWPAAAPKTNQAEYANLAKIVKWKWMMTTLAWLLGQLFLRNTKTFWGQDVMKGSRKKLKILISSRHGSWVWHYCEYFERQFENAFFQVESAQT